MQEAVIIDCLRTAVGKAPKGTLRNTRPDDLGGTVVGAAESLPAGSQRRSGRRDHGLRHAGGGVGQQHGPHAWPCGRDLPDTGYRR